jgi:hypothetical protein
MGGLETASNARDEARRVSATLVDGWQLPRRGGTIPSYTTL